MSFVHINNSKWDDIILLQSEVYYELEPETLDTLKSKWLFSPEYCFIYELNSNIVSYLLAHPWNSKIPPKLFQPLTRKINGQFLFLHDLAVSKKLSQSGIGKLMVNKLIKLAQNNNFTMILLVAVQNSVNFWLKCGFKIAENQTHCSDYGDNAQVMYFQFTSL